MNAKRPKRLQLYLIIGIGGFLVYYLLVLRPEAISCIRTLRSLNPDQVSLLQLQPLDYPPGEKRSLQGNDLAEFISLLSRATEFDPIGPRGGWTCSAEIDATGGAHFYLLIHQTTNNGVFIDVYPNDKRRGGCGTLRNDELKPFLEARFPGLEEREKR